jgi:hypothetical protein
MSKGTKAVFGAFLFVVVMAALQVPILFVIAMLRNGCTKYVPWAETRQYLIFEIFFNATVIILTGALIAGFVWMYRINYKEIYVRVLGCLFVLWAILTTIRGIWMTSNCGIARDPEHVVYFSWIAPYLREVVPWLKIAMVLGTAYRIFATRLDRAE